MSQTKDEFESLSTLSHDYAQSWFQNHPLIEDFPYRYSPLPSPTSLRVFELHSVHKSILTTNIKKNPELLSFFRSLKRDDLQHLQENIVSGPLKTINLDNNPEFEALYYSWGSPYFNENETAEERDASSRRSYFILCDGYILKVTRNLRDALQILRLRTDSEGYRDYGLDPYDIKTAKKCKYLWIDAVCINQEDIFERNCQVSLMGQIYSSCELVTIWLGPADESTADAFSALRKLGMLFHPGKDRKELLRRAQEHSPFHSITYKALAIPEVSISEWRAMILLFRRSWFSRTWIVQEIVCPPTLRLMCGSSSECWNIFMGIITFLVQAEWFVFLIDKVDISPECVDFVWSLVWLKTYTSLFERELSLLQCLACTRDHYVRDPRDKIYSLRALALETSGSLYPLIPDYNSSVSRVYTQATRVILKSEQRLQVLGILTDRKHRKIHELPSWVCDFSAGNELTPLLIQREENSSSACGHLSWRLDTESLHNPILIVQGVRCGMVAKLSEDECKVEEETINFFLALDQAQVVHKLSVFELMVKVLFADARLSKGRDFKKQTQALTEYWSLSMCGIIREIQEEKTNRKLRCNLDGVLSWNEPIQRPFTKKETKLHKLRSAVESLLAAEAAESLLREEWNRGARLVDAFKDGGMVGIKELYSGVDSPSLLPFRRFPFPCHLFRVIQGRKVFVTEVGHVGICAESIELGDEVWILAGAETPFVLKPLKNGNYQVTGEAYVYGIMHGEAVESGIERLQEIRLE